MILSLQPSDTIVTVKVIELFHELRRASHTNREKSGTERRFAGGMGGGLSSVLAEITQKSQYAQSIQADVDKYCQVIKDLGKKIVSLKVSSMRQLLGFVRDTDNVLDKLADEVGVLKNFEWPPKYDIFREACALYKEMNGLKEKFTEWKIPSSRSAPDELKEMEKFTVSL